jgi:hypothetical protein
MRAARATLPGGKMPHRHFLAKLSDLNTLLFSAFSHIFWRKK